MSQPNIIEGKLVVTGSVRIAVVCSRFNHLIVDQLQAGCLDVLHRHGVDPGDVTVVKVPGAFELPVAVRKLANSGNWDAVIALGAVIRGSTPHFDHVAGACTSGLAAAAADSGVPVIFGVLTVDSIEQAIERAGTKAGNKGGEAAATAIEMISVLRQI
jgi:6,7-dimethyl-8-ribityllumazine synthase